MFRLRHFVFGSFVLLFLHASCGQSAIITLLVDGNLVEIEVDEKFVGFLTELAKVIVQTADTNISIDVNECASNLTHNCDAATEVCKNADGTFYCLCKEGFVRPAENALCEKDFCLESNITCEFSRVCNQDQSDLSCICAPGFHHNGSHCEIITACNPNNCPSNSQCSSFGSQATCTCNDGYQENEVSGDGSGGSGSIGSQECTDIDECAEGLCDTNADCDNFEGGYTCSCKIGFTGDGSTCQDIDECDETPCHSNAVCDNFGGGFSCGCENGYAGDGVTCHDIDECTTGLHDCDTNKADCQNNDGSFDCTCNAGYTGDGVACLDIDECSPDNPCDSASTSECSNSPGGFQCLCKDGYNSNPNDNFACLDIDECQTNAHNCPANSACNNLGGGFECICDVGYEKIGSLCEDIVECGTAADNCTDHSTCSDVDGSFVCDCISGYQENGSLCEDIDECETDADDCGSEETTTCTNTGGGFECSCNAGYIDVGANGCIRSDGVIQVSVSVTSLTGRRKREVTDDFTEDLQSVLSTLLNAFGFSDSQINVTIVSKTLSSDNVTTIYELVIASDPEVRKFLENQLANIQAPIGSFEFERLFYTATTEFTGTSNVSALASSTAEQLCGQIEEFVLDNLNATNSVANGTTFVCTGNVTGGVFDFNVVLDGAYAGLFNFSEIIMGFNTFQVQSSAVCEADSCAPDGDCIQHFGSIECTCSDNALFDLNITNPGTQCVRPILPLQCNSDNTAVLSLYIGYFINLGIDTSTIRLINSSCAGTANGTLLIFDTGFDTCGWNSTFDANDNIVYTNTITNAIDGVATNPITISFPVTCSYPRIFISSNDDDEDPVVINIISTTLIVQNAQNTGTLSATITVYEDENLTTALLTNNALKFGEEVYIHASHSASTASNFMKLQTCWATPTTDSSDATRNDLITNGCSDDSTLVETISNGDSESATFKFSVRPFQNFDELYIHCQVEVCAAQCQNACPGASGRRRRDTESKPDNIFTIGPLRTIENDNDGDDDDTQSPEGPSQPASGAVNVPAVVVGVVAAVVVIVVLVLVYMRHRRNNGHLL